ncbi:hypothetical protein NEMIN01_2039 [Nematocida minor]|uniref:uncharacterized protein n=1 Tax=Nematocida minor TaxID=1912983 RepID=UPI00221FE5DF|nr:uncharacterized protein NEMIN01_2039 [Nematocida minor]KAI5192475.1 hypothetical protein NEMIN01_2039 [Nematocida minor]
MQERKKFFTVNPLFYDRFRSPGDFSFECEHLTDRIFSYSSEILISKTEEYKESFLLPMSLWSIIAVDLLDIKSDSTVLDMCCAPGMKLIYSGLVLKLKAKEALSGAVEDSKAANAPISITGIDISKNRLSITKSLVKKYKVPGVRLLLGNAETSVSTPVVQIQVGKRELQEKKDKIKETAELGEKEVCRCNMEENSYPPYYTSTGLRKIGHAHQKKYSRILVDPECSQTSTVKYLEGKRPPEKNYPIHQTKILQNSIEMLKPGGIVIYSTCTFEDSENEKVVEEVLKTNPHISRVPIEDETVRKYTVSTKNVEEKKNALPYGDSLFIAKLKYDKHL